MRRYKREVKDNAYIEKLLNTAEICRLGLSHDNKPYVVPMNYGYSNNKLYFHCAKEGKKIDYILANPNVCFEIEGEHQVVDGGDVACKWSMHFSSIIGFGKASIIEDYEAKIEGLNILMAQYSKNKSFQYTDKQVEAVAIIVVNIEEMTCKSSGF
jgi:nitroimidazol reductase NimA-like FMN-containing flavoprotein (pyridoxamine 5'-phosphate oxidase superfamily)